MIKRIWMPRWWAAAFTFYPWIFVATFVQPANYVDIVKHETVHLGQQKAWHDKVPVLGLLAWYFCYLFVLPVGWNPFRRKWELEAYRAQGYDDKWIDALMAGPPYMLWW